MTNNPVQEQLTAESQIWARQIKDAVKELIAMKGEIWVINHLEAQIKFEKSKPPVRQ